MERPRISVCIVTCNQRDFIELCLRSVLEQSVNAEIGVIVGDDASDDGTSEIVARLATTYPDLIKHIRHPVRVGVFANLRYVIAAADGDLIARVDGDDYWLPGKLQRQVEYLQANPRCAAIYTNAITVDETGNRIGLFNDVGDMRFDLAALLRRGNVFNNSSMLFRAIGRDAWLDIEEPQIDYRVHLWQARHGFLAHLGEPLAAYRVNTRGSMVAEMNDHVRELYWEAIQSVSRDLVSDSDYAHGLADFLRRVFFRSIRTRRGRLLREWRARVIASSPYGALCMDVLTVAAILRISVKEVTGLLRRDVDGRSLRVLYRH